MTVTVKGDVVNCRQQAGLPNAVLREGLLQAAWKTIARRNARGLCMALFNGLCTDTKKPIISDSLVKL